MDSSELYIGIFHESNLNQLAFGDCNSLWYQSFGISCP